MSRPGTRAEARDYMGSPSLFAFSDVLQQVGFGHVAIAAARLMNGDDGIDVQLQLIDFIGQQSFKAVHGLRRGCIGCRWIEGIGFEYGFRKSLHVINTTPADWEERRLATGG